MTGKQRALAAIEPEYKEKYLIMPGITGPYSQQVFMMGLENVLIMMYDDPEGLKEAVGKRVRHAVQLLDELIALGRKRSGSEKAQPPPASSLLPATRNLWLPTPNPWRRNKNDPIRLCCRIGFFFQPRYFPGVTPTIFLKTLQ